MSEDSVLDLCKVILKEMFGPINDYYALLNTVMDLKKRDKIAQEIAQNKIDVNLLARALVGGGIITAVIDLVVGSEVTVPDIIMIPLIMVAILASSAIIHPFLKLLGGKAPFRQTFFANAMVSIASPPITTLAFIFLAWIGQPNSAAASCCGSMMLFPLLSSVHKVSQIKVFLAMMGFSLVSVIIVLIVIVQME